MPRELTVEEKERQDALLKAEEERLQKQENSRSQDSKMPMSKQIRAAQQKMREAYKEGRKETEYNKFMHADAYQGEAEKQATEKTVGFRRLLRGTKAVEARRETALIQVANEQHKRVSASLKKMSAKLDAYETYLKNINDPIAQKKRVSLQP